MDIRIEIITKDEWQILAEDAHRAVFNENRTASSERIDYALLATKSDKSEVLGYVTVKELDDESVYWQYGGAFDSIKGKVYSFSVYKAFLSFTKERYKRISTRVENGNIVYLKMAMKMGFRIIGTRNFKENIFVELLLEFDDAV